MAKTKKVTISLTAEQQEEARRQSKSFKGVADAMSEQWT